MTSQRLGRARFSSTAGGFGFRRRVRTISSFTVVALLAGLLQVLAAAPATAAQSPDLAPFGTVTASASQNDQDGTFPAGNTIDGDPATRWASGNGPDDATSVFTAWLQSRTGSMSQSLHFVGRKFPSAMSSPVAASEAIMQNASAGVFTWIACQCRFSTSTVDFLRMSFMENEC